MDLAKVMLAALAVLMVVSALAAYPILLVVPAVVLAVRAGVGLGDVRTGR